MPDQPPLIVTPTARLARQLSRSLAAEATGAGRTAWLAPRVLPFATWLGILRADYFLDADDDRVPIDDQQALVLWQSLVDQEVFVGEPRVAELAARAWRTLHEYELEPPERWPAPLLSEDSARFRDWAARFRQRCARDRLVDEWAFAASLPDLLADRRVPAPDAVELAGFDLPPTPLQQRILAALETAGTVITRRDAPAAVAALEPLEMHLEPDDELRAAAAWACRRLEASPGQRLAVVVPDLAGRVARVEQVFRQVFDPPGHALREPAPEPWHVSLGEPLERWPLVADALAVLGLYRDRLTQPQAARVLRSPFLAGWEAEAPARAQALARLARNAPYDITPRELQWVLTDAGATACADAWDRWGTVRRDAAAAAWPSEWAAQFQQELTALGFGQGRGLDSREYQVLQRWHGLLEAFAALDAVMESPLARQRALTLLRDRARSTVFREHDPGAPLEILGVEEAVGSRFDALWITTLDSDTWPGPTRRDPLMPAPVQSRVPRATSESCLDRARLELELLKSAAREVCGSFSRGSDEAPRAPTGLLAECPITAAPGPAATDPAPQETRTDDVAPALEAAEVRGGTGVLQNHADCPFRAFAERRLAARDLTPPRPGLDAARRGTLVHEALEHFWQHLPDQAALLALDATELAERIDAAVEAALDALTRHYRLALPAAGRRLERDRLRQLLARWMEVEQARPPFSVGATEHKLTLQIAALTLTGKIDRVDRLDDGSTLVIDYKTGKPARSGWVPDPRMADLQLPAYAVTLEPRPDAIAFARVWPDEPGFDGLSEHDTGTPGVLPLAAVGYGFKAYDAWPELLTSWQTHLEALARDFAAGTAAVDPRRPQVCERCHLHALCRIHERAPLAAPAPGEAFDD